MMVSLLASIPEMVQPAKQQTPEKIIPRRNAVDFLISRNDAL